MLSGEDEVRKIIFLTTGLFMLKNVAGTGNNTDGKSPDLSFIFCNKKYLVRLMYIMDIKVRWSRKVYKNGNNDSFMDLNVVNKKENICIWCKSDITDCRNPTFSLIDS